MRFTSNIFSDFFKKKKQQPNRNGDIISDKASAFPLVTATGILYHTSIPPMAFTGIQTTSSIANFYNREDLFKQAELPSNIIPFEVPALLNKELDWENSNNLNFAFESILIQHPFLDNIYLFKFLKSLNESSLTILNSENWITSPKILRIVETKQLLFKVNQEEGNREAEETQSAISWMNFMQSWSVPKYYIYASMNAKTDDIQKAFEPIKRDSFLKQNGEESKVEL
jgi:hypothetical protein